MEIEDRATGPVPMCGVPLLVLACARAEGPTEFVELACPLHEQGVRVCPVPLR